MSGPLDASILSDEAAARGAEFHGCLRGMCCQDLAGGRRTADFDWFEYREREYRATPFSVTVET